MNEKVLGCVFCDQITQFKNDRKHSKTQQFLKQNKETKPNNQQENKEEEIKTKKNVRDEQRRS